VSDALLAVTPFRPYMIMSYNVLYVCRRSEITTVCGQTNGPCFLAVRSARVVMFRTMSSTQSESGQCVKNDWTLTRFHRRRAETVCLRFPREHTNALYDASVLASSGKRSKSSRGLAQGLTKTRRRPSRRFVKILRHAPSEQREKRTNIFP